MKSLILGGVKSGKSGFAESIATESGKEVIVVATASADDSEMAARIRHHKATRPDHWQTIEEPLYLGSTLANLDQTLKQGQSNSEPGLAPVCVIVDCLTLWLSNLLMLDDPQVFEQERDSFVVAINSFDHQIILVSNETNMGIVPMGELSRRFCDEAGLLHQHLGRQVDQVVLMVAGLSHTIKG